MPRTGEGLLASVGGISGVVTCRASLAVAREKTVAGFFARMPCFLTSLPSYYVCNTL
jgi:hypothetical protein